MEHLSRRTTRDVDHLVIVSDPTQRGLVAAEMIAHLRHELDIDIKEAHLILNKFSGAQLPPALLAPIDALDVPLLGIVPDDERLMEFEITGRPLIELSDASRIYQSLAAMLSAMLYQ